MFSRFLLFGLTNIAVIVLASVVLSVLGVGPYLTSTGLNLESLFFFSVIFGFAGAIISLMISKWSAKRMYRMKIIESPANSREKWLVDTVRKHAEKMGVGMPEVGVYESQEVNAFATGASRNNSLVAFSTGIMGRMNPDELEGVIAHEVAHIANGDMVTMTLIQGVINTFVIFFSRVAAYFVANILRRDDEEGVSGIAYFITSIVFEIVFGILAQTIVCWFSRQREFRADRDSANSAGKEKMIAALQNLQRHTQLEMPSEQPQMATMKISSSKSILGLFSTHPPLEDRIQRLRSL